MAGYIDWTAIKQCRFWTTFCVISATLLNFERRAFLYQSLLLNKETDTPYISFIRVPNYVFNSNEKDEKLSFKDP